MTYVSEIKEQVERQNAVDQDDPTARNALRAAVLRIQALGWRQIDIERELNEILDNYEFTENPPV